MRDAILMPFAVCCSRCGDYLAYEQAPRAPTFSVIVECVKCGWKGRIDLPRLPIDFIERPFGEDR